MKFGVKNILRSIGALLLALIMVAVTVAASIFADSISLWLYGIGSLAPDQKTLSAGQSLGEDIVQDGTILLKNSEGDDGKMALPLSEEEISKVNVFGWAGYDWMTSTFGSGFSNTNLEKIKLFPALEEAGIEYNTTLFNMYQKFYSEIVRQWGLELQEYRGDIDVGPTKKNILHEPGAAYYTDEIINQAKNFSDVALVVIGRTGGEGADLPNYQVKQVQSDGSRQTVTDYSRHYLELSVEEEEMIAAAKKACDKVIVIFNNSNIMECGFLEDDEIDAALYVGLTGLTGVRSVIDLLKGEKEVTDENGNTEIVQISPSGRTVDTYAYDITTSPSYVNAGYRGATKYQGLDPTNSYRKGYYDAYIDYHEGIYVGYRYYETAAEEGYIDYDTTVQYPFGYGLSYTNFEWSVVQMTLGENKEVNYGNIQLGMNDHITMFVNVKNIGDHAGKDTVQLYYTAPYTEGEIEKSSVVLGSFAKTPLLQPGEEALIKLEMSVQSMSSYDYSDANNNGHSGYELDGGKYYLKLMNNSHELGNIADGSRLDAVIECSVPEEGYQYTTDEETGNTVENRFTGEDTIDNADLDGSEETVPVTYMTRSDFEGTFPKEKILRERSAEAYAVAMADAPTQEQLERTGDDNLEMPTFAADNGLIIDDLMQTEGFNDPMWDLVVEQITTPELFELVRDGFHKTEAIESIGKPQYLVLDGPAGLNTRVTSSQSCSFVAYPNEALIAQTWDIDLSYALGLSIGSEARDSGLGIRGWFGPAANIHRNPFCGRNGEYYSEDAYLSGMMAAYTIKGAKNMGLYSYLKHFAVNDSESLREGLYTFLTEQTLREVYLRPFEIAVKEGGANGMMTAMNRLGRVWSGASRALCTDILRNEWGFKGVLVTDWVDSGSGYMPEYKGLWAGNDTWDNNPEADNLFNDAEYMNNAEFITFAQRAAKNMLWATIETEKARLEFDPDAPIGNFAEGFTYNRTWIVYVVLVDLVLLAGAGVLVFFTVRDVRKKNKSID